ncbi:hypothetical protein DM872_12245 [Pseudomonas taiwanensis]|uniref:DUF1302 domain-containing protein n=1 Tax=Pseudomonas TaxID=286 RepID=UPI0015BBB0C4|nr:MULTISPECIES: DUF1302 family protein [Pseudomonas]MDH4559756.1 DUF1302 domain-containing protein [Pseudomonas sp. BN411]MDH4651377.1 DUF1302 domain-containing protein [Pseudomonas sp. BN606]MDH4871064.1 DUF1302 domain-containing protein [Pseudomonas sp. BN515]NWL77624.1 hypothetical protein [Pseudomonas taiwanensis]
MQKQQKEIARFGKIQFGQKKLRAAIALATIFSSGASQAVTLKADQDWTINFDTSLQWLAGWRVEGRDARIANNPNNHAADHKFDRGEMVTNRVQGLFELQGVYQDNYGFRVSASAWNDFAYDDDVEVRPGYLPTYSDGKYSSHTKKYHIRGAELLDAFVFSNFEVADHNASVRLGRFSQQWGNAVFFGYSGIAFGQHPVDFIKGFSQPGSSVKELILPRTQVYGSFDINDELSIAAQYFLEWRPNRFPEGATYLAPADILFEGPDVGGSVVPGAVVGKSDDPDDINGNFGVRLDWTPAWANGDRIGFYYRQYDEPEPVATLNFPQVELKYAEKSKMYAMSYETAIGANSLGFEVNYRQDTALQSVFPSEVAKGDLVNVLANSLISLPGNSLWDAATVLGEVTYTHLTKVHDKDIYNGEGYACKGNRSDGCGTDNAVAVALLFEPSWLQILPSTDISLPIFVQYGVTGNPAYAAGGFYAEDSVIASIGVKAAVAQKHYFALQYQDYYWNPTGRIVNGAPGGDIYAGGNGPTGLNDKGWVSLSYNTSF